MDSQIVYQTYNRLVMRWSVLKEVHAFVPPSPLATSLQLCVFLHSSLSSSQPLRTPCALLPQYQAAKRQKSVATDVFQNGLFVSPSCDNFTTDCIDDTSCTLNETCLDVPHDLDVDVMFTSVCLPTMDVFEFGDSCASGSKQCPAGLVCQDIALDGVIIGTFCGSPSPTLLASSCAELEPCEATLECFETFVSGKGGAAQCADKESADILFQTFMTLAGL